MNAEEAGDPIIGAQWLASRLAANSQMSDAGVIDETVALAKRYRATITHLAALLDGVLADDPAAIRDAAAWLAANRPEVDG